MENKFKLPKGYVTVKPIVKSTYLIPDKSHRAAFLAPGAKKRYVNPLLKNGQYSNVLTNAEKEFFESVESGMDFKVGDLSVHKKENNFWDNFQVLLGKEDYTIDKSNPVQYLEYKVLLANTEEVAGSIEEYRNKRKASYNYVLVDSEEEAQNSSKEADREELAWSEYGNIKNDRTRMFDVLRVYGRRPSNTASDDFLRAQMKLMLKEDLEGFLNIVRDPNLEIKILIDKAVSVGALTKRSGGFSLPGGDKLGTTLYETASFLNKPENQEILLTITARVANAGDDTRI